MRACGTYTVVTLGLLSGPPSGSSTFLLFLVIIIVLLVFLLFLAGSSSGFASVLLVTVFRLGELSRGGLGAPLGALGDDVGLGDGGVYFRLLGQGLIAELLPAIPSEMPASVHDPGPQGSSQQERSEDRLFGFVIGGSDGLLVGLSLVSGGGFSRHDSLYQICS